MPIDPLTMSLPTSVVGLIGFLTVANLGGLITVVSYFFKYMRQINAEHRESMLLLTKQHTDTLHQTILDLTQNHQEALEKCFINKKL